MSFLLEPNQNCKSDTKSQLWQVMAMPFNLQAFYSSPILFLWHKLPETLICRCIMWQVTSAVRKKSPLTGRDLQWILAH